jgi:hypothetical protein
MRKLIPLLTAAVLLSGGLAVLPQPAAAQVLSAVASTEAPLRAVPVHWDRGYGYGGGYGGGYYAPPPPPPPWYGRPHYRSYYGGGGYGGGYYAPPPPRWGGGGWYR